MRDPKLHLIEPTLAEIPFPKKLAVELCADCNFACVMCHHPAMRRPKGVMPFGLWKRCADEVLERSPATECWFSFCGEPLLAPDLLLDMIRYGKAIGLRSVNVNTNGMLLVPELADRLLDTGVDLVVFGLDGLSPGVYESVRVNGEHAQVYRNVETFLAKRLARSDGPEVQVQFIEMDQNAHELPAFTDYWLQRGAVVKARNQLSWGGKFATPLKVPESERIPCPWALTMMHVFWDGRVPRCPGDTEGEEGAGNAWHESLSALWGRLGPYRAKHIDRRFAALPERCQTCTDWMTGAAARIRPEHGPFREWHARDLFPSAVAPRGGRS